MSNLMDTSKLMDASLFAPMTKKKRARKPASKATTRKPASKATKRPSKALGKAAYARKVADRISMDISPKAVTAIISLPTKPAIRKTVMRSKTASKAAGKDTIGATIARAEATKYRATHKFRTKSK